LNEVAIVGTDIVGVGIPELDEAGKLSDGIGDNKSGASVSFGGMATPFRVDSN
jgi:hypothetical protein